MGVTIIDRLFAVGDALTGKFLRAMGGVGSGNIFPSPKSGLPPVAAAGSADVAVVDADGSLRMRASALTSRLNFRDDFPGASLNTALTGTLTFVAGSTTVTGTGTLFNAELSRDLYIKLNADGETAWTKVRRVLSNTSLELEVGYLGASGGPAASSSTKWPTTTGAGGSFTVGTSLVNILSGTTSGARTFIARDVDFALIHVDFVALRISARLATQTGFAGLFDNVAAPTQQAAFIFDGTVNTVVRCRSSFSASANDTQETVVTLPYGLTTNLTTVHYSIDITTNKVIFTIAGAVVATHSYHTPEQFTFMDVAVGILNTAIAVTSTVTVDMVLTRAFDQVDDSANVPDDEMHYVQGILATAATTADQIVVSVTVPAGKVLYIIGYSLSSSNNAVGAAPAKIGKNTVTVEPAAPGAIDGNIMFSFILNTSAGGANLVIMNYGDLPRRFGFAGDVVKITVTPSGAGATNWRATLEYILKDAIER